MKIGVFGTGQLCLMMADEAHKLDLELKPFGEHENLLLNKLCEPEYFNLNDTSKLFTLLEQVDVITFETESVPAHIVDLISKNPELSKKSYPNLDALQVFKNRIQEKNYFTSLNLPTAKYVPLLEFSDAEKATTVLGFPLIIKTSMGGYDGKGQSIIHSLDELQKAWIALEHQPCIAEEFITFEKEISIVGARDLHDNIVFYPVAQNYHRKGILRLSLVEGQSPFQGDAEKIMTKVMQDLDYRGCMALEFFVHNNQLMLNEVAPRVHNSGHWTIDSSDTSQFLLHLKAISGDTLSKPNCDLPSAMFNCISDIPEKFRTLNNLAIKLYDYGKEAKPNRKLGHVNFTSSYFTDDFKEIVSSYLDNENEEEFLSDIVVNLKGR